MNYQHHYHAGSISDLFKHTILFALLQNFFHKSTPITYIDTHAGAGCYDLRATQSQKTKEYVLGALKIFQYTPVPKSLSLFAELLHKQQPTENQLTFYPGSPLWAALLLRSQDTLLLIEQQEEISGLLRQWARHAPHRAAMHLHTRDGYEGLNGLIPPTQKRGLIFMDPPFEDIQEFQKISQSLKTIYQKWSTAVTCVWTPLKSTYPLARFYKAITQLPARTLMRLQFILDPNPDPNRIRPGLKGSQLLIINPPFAFDREAIHICNDLKKILHLPHALIDCKIITK
jgi:23S rRNA (adenine2030-N6)-methyltransferase